MALGTAQPRGRYFVEALGRGLALLDCFIEDPGPHSLIELSRRVGLGMPTTLRLIRTLVEDRLRPPGCRHQALPPVVENAAAPGRDDRHPGLCRPGSPSPGGPGSHGRRINGMAVLDDTEVRHAIRVSSARMVSANIPPGSLFPPHATAMGKVLLAALEPGVVRELALRRPFERFSPTTITCVDDLLSELRVVARQGYASSNGEWEPGLRSLAAPVHTRDGRVVAAVCIVVVRPDLTIHSMERDFLPALLHTARCISDDLGYGPAGLPDRTSVRSRAE